MEWKSLSNEAQGVIEWVENPFTGRHSKIEVRLGEVFTPTSNVKILITSELYKEILQYVMSDDNLDCKQYDGYFTFGIC